MMELCEVYQRRNRRIFGERTLAEQQNPPKVASGLFGKNRENSTPFKNSNTLSNHLQPIHEQETRQSRCRHKMALVTSQRQVSQIPNIQGQQRKPQQAKVVTTKQSIARQSNAEENNERRGGRAALKGDTMIYRRA